LGNVDAGPSLHNQFVLLHRMLHHVDLMLEKRRPRHDVRFCLREIVRARLPLPDSPELKASFEARVLDGLTDCVRCEAVIYVNGRRAGEAELLYRVELCQARGRSHDG